VKKPCKYEDCRYTHHELLHDSDKLPVIKARPSTARSGLTSTRSSANIRSIWSRWRSPAACIEESLVRVTFRFR
jgi:hypothetical protein